MKVIQLTEPQVWVLMGVFTTAIFGMLSWQTVSFNRNLTTSIDSIREVMGYRFEAMDSKLESVQAELRADIGAVRANLGAEIAGLSTKLDGLDRDVQALTRHVFGSDPRSS